MSVLKRIEESVMNECNTETPHYLTLSLWKRSSLAGQVEVVQALEHTLCDYY